MNLKFDIGVEVYCVINREAKNKKKFIQKGIIKKIIFDREKKSISYEISNCVPNLPRIVSDCPYFKKAEIFLTIKDLLEENSDLKEAIDKEPLTTA